METTPKQIVSEQQDTSKAIIHQKTENLNLGEGCGVYQSLQPSTT